MDNNEKKLYLKVANLNFSVRTNNVLRLANINYIGDLIQCEPIQLLRMPNCGRRSLNEIEHKLKEMLLQLGTILEGWPPQDLLEKVEIYNSQDAELHAIYLDEKNIYEYLAKWLTERERKIIISRIRDLTTLQEVGFQFSITRERIRQIEAKALRKLRRQNIKISFQKFINENKNKIVERLFSGKQTLSLIESNKLNFIELLSIIIVSNYNNKKDGIKWFLDKYANIFSNYLWYNKKNEIDSSRLKKYVEVVIKEIDNVPLPIPKSLFLQRYCKKIPNKFINLVLALAQIFIYRGFICGSKKKPIIAAVNLYAFLIEHNPKNFLSKSEFIEKKYDKKLNYKIKTKHHYRYFFYHIADQFSHLFSKHPHFGICPVECDYNLRELGDDNYLDDYELEVDYENEPLLDENKNELDKKRSLKNILYDNGPMHITYLNEKYAKQIKINENRTYKICKFTLNQSEDFDVMLPGWYGLREHHNNPNRYIKNFLNKDVLEKYSVHKYGCKNNISYKAYTTLLEQELCVWAKNNLDGSLFNSILYVSNIDKWNISYDEKKIWKEKKNKSKFYLKESIEFLDYKKNLLPPLTTVLFVLYLSRQFGYVSYSLLLSIARRYKTDDKVEHSSHKLNINLMMIISLMGAVEAPLDYLHPHSATTLSNELIKLLSDNYICNKSLNWSDNVGKQIKDKIINNSEKVISKKNWITNEYLRNTQQFINRLKN